MQRRVFERGTRRSADMAAGTVMPTALVVGFPAHMVRVRRLSAACLHRHGLWAGWGVLRREVHREVHRENGV